MEIRFVKPVSLMVVCATLLAPVLAHAQEAPAQPVAVEATEKASAQPEEQAKPATIDYSGKTEMDVTDTSPLVVAIMKQDAEQVRQHIGTVKDKTADGSYPIIVAAQHATAPIAQILTGNGADVHVKDAHGRGPLHYAAMRGDADQLKLFSALSADVNALDARGISPLFYALLNKKLEAATALKESAAININQQGADGNPLAFLVVSQKDRPEVVQWMVDAGLNILMRDMNDRGLMDVAKKLKHEQSLTVLQTAYEAKVREYIEQQKALEEKKKQKEDE